MQHESSPKHPTVDIRLAEFAALRQEIAQRSLFQQGLMVLNLTALGAIMGLVLGPNVDDTLLLVVPIISPALGTLWFNHHVAISRIGDYIATKLWIWPAEWETPSWELWLSECEPEELHWWSSSWWPTVQLIFCGAPIAILGTAPLVHRPTLAEWALWSAGIAVTAYLVIASTRLVMRPHSDARREHVPAGDDG